MASKRGRRPVLPQFEAEYRQSIRAAAARDRLRARRLAAGLTVTGTERKRAPNGSPEKPRAPRTEEQKQRAAERRRNPVPLAKELTEERKKATKMRKAKKGGGEK